MQYRPYYEQVLAMEDEIRSPRLVGARVLRVEDERLRPETRQLERERQPDRAGADDHDRRNARHAYGCSASSTRLQ